MEDKGGIDGFSRLLFESTGDSEAIFEVNVASEDAKMVAAEDDAKSCSWDFMVFDDLEDTHDEDYHVLDDDDDDDDDYYDDCYDDEEEEEEGEEVSSRRTSGQQKKRRVSFDSISTTTMESLSEMEKSRLFWEACLAS